MTDPMGVEFDRMAEWTAEVAADLGGSYAVPAACRGSAHPAALEWLLGALAIGAGDQLLDCGAGLGGPAQFAVERAHARPVLVEPMPNACRGSRRLFGLPVIRADGTALPFRPGAFAKAWSLGVLCTMPDQERFLRELRRVISSDGRLGLLVVLANTALPDARPSGNDFPTEDRLRALLRASGWRTLSRAPAKGFGPPPQEWTRRIAEVDAEVERRRRDEPGWRALSEQNAAMRALIDSGALRIVLLALAPDG